jgi:NADPH:quinone reductase-like Zn-dependent oxidoreductase
MSQVMMKAVWSVPGEAGGRVEVREVPRPEPSAGQVRVRVRASAINRGELLALSALKTGTGAIGGVEFAGEVDALGPGVIGWKPGDAVMGHGRGAQAQYVCVDARALMPRPKRLDWHHAAAFPNVFTTAHDAMITNGSLARGEAVLVNAASSGIGMAALQIARWAGASTIIATSRSTDKLERLRPLGLTHAIRSDDQGAWVDQVATATGGRGVDLIVDSVGGGVFEANLRTMALDGRLIGVGRLGGRDARLDLDFLALRRLRLIGVTFRTRTAEQTLACVQACARDLLGPLEHGEINPVVDSVFPLASIAEAHNRMRSNQQIGKIVLDVE